MSKLIYPFGGENLIFAHGFDEFVTTRPPSTNSTSINDEK